MPTVKLTKRVVEGLNPGESDSLWWDEQVKGFGLKVTPKGGRSYIVQWRTGGRGAPTKRLTIGRHGSPWTVEMARDEARRVLRMVADGHDPIALRAQQKTPKPEAVGDAVAKIIDEFIERDQKPKNRTWQETERVLKKELANWSERSIQEISRRDVLDVLDGIADRGAMTMARTTLAYTRRLFNWCVERGIRETTPLHGVKPPTRPVVRDRVLADDELLDVWRQCSAVGHPFGTIVRLLILTAQRREEVTTMRRGDVDLASFTWTIPRERAKNDKAHAVPLSQQAIALLDSLPVVAGDGDFLLTANGRGSFNGFSKAKERLDNLVNAARIEAGREPLPAWRLHDLRRTAASGMARLGVRSEVIERVLNHTHPGGSALSSVYQRYEFGPEMRAALEAWGRHVDGLGSNVIAMTVAAE